MRGMRPWSLRFEREHAEIDNWLKLTARYAREDYALAVEVAECQRLVKGYGDTHARGMRNFKQIEALLPQLASQLDAPQRLRQLREAALKDEEGKQLEALLRDWNLGKTATAKVSDKVALGQAA